MQFEVRNYQMDDIPQIVALHISCWQNNYRGLMAQESLDSIEEKVWIERRQAFFAKPDRIKLVIYGDARNALAFADGGAARDANFSQAGELYALYVKPRSQSSGLGQALLAAMKERLAAAGYKQMLVKTLHNNPQSRRFYEKVGGQLVEGASSFEFAGHAYQEAMYLFDL